MYQAIEYSFKNNPPIAEVVAKTPPEAESNLYFQLLADYGIALNKPQQEAVEKRNKVCLMERGNLHDL